MTFLEALKTQQPMRRKSWWRRAPGGPGARWLIVDVDGEWTWVGGGSANPPSRGDYLADDWEVAG